MGLWLTALLIVFSYIMGSFPSALVAGKRHNIDIRQHGSGNLGGTNTFRVLGKKAGYIVSITDLLKGAIAALLGLLVANDYETGVWCGIAATLGHSYPIFAGFRGGKSVATGGGALFVLNPIATLIGALAFAIMLFSVRYVSLASIIAALTVGLLGFVTVDSVAGAWGTLFICLFVIYRHKANISRLLKGTEKKVLQKK